MIPEREDLMFETKAPILAEMSEEDEDLRNSFDANNRDSEDSP